MNESERRNRLLLNRLEPEIQRHQPLTERPRSEFESLPPSHSLRDGRFSNSPFHLTPHMSLVGRRALLPGPLPAIEFGVEYWHQIALAQRVFQ